MTIADSQFLVGTVDALELAAGDGRLGDRELAV